MLNKPFVFLSFLLLLAGCSHQGSLHSVQDSSVDNEIDFYRKKVAKHRTSYALYAQLGGAILKKAKIHRDFSLLQDSKEALKKSLAIQANILAYRNMAELQNYRHRFAQSLKWSQRAADISAYETEIMHLQAEALLGLGATEAAERLLFNHTKPADFNLLSAQALWHQAQQHYELAAQAFKQAADIATKQQLSARALWALTNVAGMYLDSGRPDEAVPYLHAAAAINKDNLFLQIHFAEYDQAKHDLKQALATYDALLKRFNDPDVNAKAYQLAKMLSLSEKADQYFLDAEAGYLKTIDAGEIFALGGLAQHYCNANKKLDLALLYARENLKYKKDREANATLACLLNKSKAFAEM